MNEGWIMINGDFKIRTQHFQLTSHQALGPVPTKVKEMLWAYLTDGLEYWILIGKGKLVIFPNDQYYMLSPIYSTYSALF